MGRPTSWRFSLVRTYTPWHSPPSDGSSCSANLASLFFNAEEKLERYNAPDALKAQHTAFLTRGHVCYSDMGRILCSVVTDTTGWNDAFCGVSDAEQIKTKYGLRDFGAARNGMYRSGREGLLIEMGKWGLGKRDLVTNVNFSAKSPQMIRVN